MLNLRGNLLDDYHKPQSIGSSRRTSDASKNYSRNPKYLVLMAVLNRRQPRDFTGFRALVALLPELVVEEITAASVEKLVIEKIAVAVESISRVQHPAGPAGDVRVEASVERLRVGSVAHRKGRGEIDALVDAFVLYLAPEPVRFGAARVVAPPGDPTPGVGLGDRAGSEAAVSKLADVGDVAELEAALLALHELLEAYFRAQVHFGEHALLASLLRPAGEELRVQVVAQDLVGKVQLLCDGGVDQGVDVGGAEGDGTL